MKPARHWVGVLGRWLMWMALGMAGLQIFFVARIATWAAFDPQSTAFQRSEAWRIAHTKGRLPWRQQWVPYGQIAESLKRAVIASEDDGFAWHDGVDWEAMEKAWARNAAQVQRAMASGRPGRTPKVVGGSTITQQLAKNLLLSGERNLPRKAQELALSMALETLLDKERILEIYLNSVEWGEGIFGAEAAAQHYFRKPAARLSQHEAARLAVMLPAPKRFEKLPNSPYLTSRAAVIVGRMPNAELP
jgi:monofunctional biosynthetic peptidoglycan transglycosylase